MILDHKLIVNFNDQHVRFDNIFTQFFFLSIVCMGLVCVVCLSCVNFDVILLIRVEIFFTYSVKLNTKLFDLD
jgi:hypothetical protein